MTLIDPLTIQRFGPCCDFLFLACVDYFCASLLVRLDQTWTRRVGVLCQSGKGFFSFVRIPLRPTPLPMIATSPSLVSWATGAQRRFEPHFCRCVQVCEMTAGIFTCCKGSTTPFHDKCAPTSSSQYLVSSSTARTYDTC